MPDGLPRTESIRVDGVVVALLFVECLADLGHVGPRAGLGVVNVSISCRGCGLAAVAPAVAHGRAGAFWWSRKSPWPWQ